MTFHSDLPLDRSKIDPVYAAHHAPDHDHVMVDIESMSLSKHNALILSVGLIEFDPTPINGPLLGSRSLILINIEQQLLMGREVSKGTQKFWMGQKREASAHWTNPEAKRMNVAEACQHIKNFCRGKSRVWANGTQFDLTNLEVLNEQLGENGVGDLWHYQAPRDMRTFCRENPQSRLVPVGDALDIKGVAHDPVYDCEIQIWQVWAHYQNA